ncbi:hypothetical protein ElyMa_007033100 [Elysia marginata]|uniref:Tesmin/TSO1-like CXC domain-containing protein n=1 Tax=Elysia marginata TaxID=1093978 RepID=A0AAV4JVX4_9GAST|nr:hypothetical protein ElyMa_007033100 [Elysia marginata]
MRSGRTHHQVQSRNGLQCHKRTFSRQSQNKQAFVQYLGDILKKDRCQVLHPEGDPDTLIVNTAVTCAVNVTTVVIEEDTELLVLLLHHADLRSRPISLKSVLKTKKHKVIDILSMKTHLGPLICNFLPFLHAINGCDTTSRLFGVAKGLPLKRPKLMQISRQLQRHSVQKEKLQQISLHWVRKHWFLSTEDQRVTHWTCCVTTILGAVASSITTVQVRSLPPTSAAAKYHSLRVYLQLQDWIDKICDMKPEMWGWHLYSGRLDPCTTDLPPAPELLLKMIRCNCKSDCRPKRCPCRKHGLECSLACAECKGISCLNSPPTEPIAECDV